MTVALADQDAEDAVEIMIAWLLPLGRTAEERVTGDVLPFRMVAHVAGTEDVDAGTAAPIVSVHTMTAKSLGRTNLKTETRTTHKRLIRLGNYSDPLQLTDGRWVGVDYVDVIESPLYLPYGDDLILRKVGRYELGLTYNP